MNVNLKELPEKYRKQAEQKLGKTEQGGKPSKYRNEKTTVNGITFDSKKEAERFLILLERQKKGEISDLRLQRMFTLIEGFKTVRGEIIRPERYIADFVYTDSDGKLVVEDVKSEITRKNPAYRLKKKQMAEKYGIEITEV